MNEWAYYLSIPTVIIPGCTSAEFGLPAMPEECQVLLSWIAAWAFNKATSTEHGYGSTSRVKVSLLSCVQDCAHKRQTGQSKTVFL